MKRYGMILTGALVLSSLFVNDAHAGTFDSGVTIKWGAARHAVQGTRHIGDR